MLGAQANKKIGVTVSKKVSKRAVDRNRINRVVKEFYRHHKTEINSAHIVITAKPKCVIAAGFGTTIEELAPSHIDSVLKQTQIESLDDLLAEIGLGNRMSFMVAQRLSDNDELSAVDAVEESNRQGSIEIRGSEGMVMSYAKCCHPIPGDPIVGHISTGRGMVIHTEDCNNIAEIIDDPEKCVSVRWDPDVKGEFSVELRVELENQRGIIATLATTITGCEANIERISTVERDARFSIVNLSLNVRNRVHLARVLKKVRLIRSVLKVTRVKSRKVRKTIKNILGANE